MKRQAVTRTVALSFLGLLLLSVVSCGAGAITSLSKDEFQKKVEKIPPQELVKWLGKPSRVTDDNGYHAIWHYQNACYDKITGKKCNAHIYVLYKSAVGPGGYGDKPEVRSCEFSSD